MNALEFGLNREECGTAMRLVAKHGYRHVFRVSPSTKWLFLIKRYFPVVLMVLFLIMHEPKPQVFPWLPPFAALCFSYAGFTIWLARKNYLARWFVQEDGMQLRTHRIEVRDNGLQVDSHVTKTEMSWSCFKDVEDQSGLMLLYTDAAAALIIPRRAFPQQEDAEAFLTMMRSKIFQVGPWTKSI